MKQSVIIVFLLVLLCATMLLSISIGRYRVSLGDIGKFAGKQLSIGNDLSEDRVQLLKNLLLNIRLPRIVAAALIGAALSVSGAVFQSMFINPLVSPGLLGVLAGASFGAAVGMLLGRSWLVVQLSAFFFGSVAVLATLLMAAFNRGDRLLMLILGGVVSGALFTALLSMVKYLADPFEDLPAIVYWLMGGLSGVDRTTVVSVCGPILISIVLLLMLSSYLNVLSMGDEEARALGINVRLLQFVFISLATVISALTVVLGGIISWVGLLIPHMARMLVGPDNRVLLPASALMGGIYLLITDNMARMLFAVEIPIGILTSLAGIPFFAVILRNTRKGWP